MHGQILFWLMRIVTRAFLLNHFFEKLHLSTNTARHDVPRYTDAIVFDIHNL